MLGLVLAGLAGALIMGVAVEVWHEIESYDRRNRDEQDRRRMLKALAALEEREP